MAKKWGIIGEYMVAIDDNNSVSVGRIYIYVNNESTYGDCRKQRNRGA